MIRSIGKIFVAHWVLIVGIALITGIMLRHECEIRAQTSLVWMSDLANQTGGKLVWGWETAGGQYSPVLGLVCVGPEGMAVVHASAKLDIELTTGQLRAINLQMPPAGFHCP